MHRKLLGTLLFIAGFSLTVLAGSSLVPVVLLAGKATPIVRALDGASAGPGAFRDDPPAMAATPLAAAAAVAGVRPTPAAQDWRPGVGDPSAPGMADRATRKSVRRALLTAPMEEELARCVERDSEIGFGGGASPAVIPRGRPAVLMLDLEPTAGRVTIAGARVKDWGGASHAAVACARGALTGTMVAAVSARAGKPVQMPFLLNATRRALAAAR